MCSRAFVCGADDARSVAACQRLKQAKQYHPIVGGERAEQLVEHAVRDGLPVCEHLAALSGEGVLDTPTAPSGPGDQTAVDQSDRQRPEGLIALERRNGEVVTGGGGHPLDSPQSVPLHQGHSDLAQGGIHGPVVAVLRLFDRQPERVQFGRHHIKVSMFLHKHIELD